MKLLKLISDIASFTVLILSLNSQSAFSQSVKTRELDNYLSEYFFNKRVPSVSAGILRDGKITWLGVKGIADLEYLTYATYNSLYRIASISKPITAVGILQLYEKGLINLDQDVRNYVPSFPEKKWKITIRQLLNHTSGIRGYKTGEFHSKTYYANANEAVRVFAYDSLNFEPGTKYEYTSLGYTLLAAVVENVTKTSLEDFLTRNIFIPSGMKNTVVDRQKEIIPNRVSGYEKNSGRRFENAPLADLSIKVAGGGLLSNSEDLLLFSKALMEGTLIKPETFNLMVTQTVLKNGTKIDYGFGIALSYEKDSLKTISHTGGGTGFTTMLIINPGKNLAAVHLINISDRNLGLLASELINVELGYSYSVPTKTVSDELMFIYQSNGIDSALSRCGVILDSDSTGFNRTESELIYFSEDLLGLNKRSEAIQYLRFLIKKFQRSFAIQVALADAYYRDRNNGLALRHYRIAAQLNSDNAYVKRMIRKLSSR